MAKPLILSHPTDSIRYTRRNMRDNAYKLTGAEIENTFYYIMPKFAQQNGKIGVQTHGHPLKKNAIPKYDRNAKPAETPYDATTKYKRTIDNWRSGMMGEGSLSYRLQIRSRPEVQQQISEIESEVPFDTPNRRRVIDEIVDNLLRTIEAEEIKTGATEGVKQRYDIISNNAKREMEMRAYMERRRQKMGQGVRTKFGEDTFDVDDNFVVEDVPDFEAEDLEKQPREEVPPQEDILTEGAPAGGSAMSSTQFILEEANLGQTAKMSIESTPAERLKQELSLTQSRIYGYVRSGEQRGYNPLIRLAERIKSLTGYSSSIPKYLRTDEEIIAFSRETGIKPANVEYLRSVFDKASRDEFGSKRQKYSLSGLARANKTRGKSQVDNALEAITINTIIENVIQGRTIFDIKQDEEEFKNMFGGGDDGY